METLFNNTKNTYHTDSYPDRSKRWTAEPYFDYKIWDIPLPHITSAEMRREDLLEAIDRVARRAGVTVLRMITYRRDPSSTDLEHRINRQTIFADSHVEEFTYIISHTVWMCNGVSIAGIAAVKQQNSNTPAFRSHQSLEKLRRGADIDSYFSVPSYLIVFSQHGFSNTNSVDKRVFKFLQAIRADLLDCDPWASIFQSTSIPIEDETTKIDTVGCLAGGNRLTKHVSSGHGFTLLDDAGCGDGFTALTGPPVTIRGCKCTGAYCQSCLEKWIKGERPTCPECRKPLLLSTELRWVRRKSDCGISHSRHDHNASSFHSNS